MLWGTPPDNTERLTHAGIEQLWAKYPAYKQTLCSDPGGRNTASAGVVFQSSLQRACKSKGINDDFSLSGY